MKGRRQETGTFDVNTIPTIWRWLYRSILAVGCLFALLIGLAIWGMSRPIVHESAGYVASADAPADFALSGAFPPGARDIRYVRASRGMGGRLMAYRLSAPVDVLKDFALAEFAKHWDKPVVSVTANVRPPFDSDELTSIGQAYSADLDWMVPPSDAIGIAYTSADGQGSHRPTIFVDKMNRVLYFLMTD